MGPLFGCKYEMLPKESIEGLIPNAAMFLVVLSEGD